MAKEGLAKLTRENYNGKIKHWLDYCDLCDEDYLNLNNFTAKNFISYCFHYTNLNGSGASRALTAASSLLLEQGIEWQRNKYISRIIKGYTKIKPPETRPKKPFSNKHIQLTWKHFLNIRDYNHLTIGSGLLLGYFGGLRPGEFSYKKGYIILRYHQLQFIPNRNSCKEIQVTLYKSKTNQLSKKQERILLSCKCNKRVLGIFMPCPVHHLVRYIKAHIKLFGEFQNSDPLLTMMNGKVLRYNYVHNFMYNSINAINTNENLQMDPKFYTPHTLRIGGCTDLARANVPGHLLERFGRWTTQIWKEKYISLDFSDIAILNDTTITDIRDSMVSCPWTTS